MGKNCPAHFKEKPVADHLLDARKKGKLACSEIHGVEVPGYLASFADAIREGSVYLTLLALLLTHIGLSSAHIVTYLLLGSLAIAVWKTGRSGLLASSRMQRLTRTSEEELYEIEHHFQSEKEELREIYERKGFKGKLLEEVIEVLTADKNIELQIMLEEELGIPLEAYEHPLKQASGALIGALLAAALLIPTFWLFGLIPSAIVCGAMLTGSSILTSNIEKNRKLEGVIWTLSIALLTVGCVYFLAELIDRT